MKIETLPTPNLPLLRKVLDHINAHPEEWNQEHWATVFNPALSAGSKIVITTWAGVDHTKTVPACGTAFCIAGHALHMSGYKFSNPFETNDMSAEIGIGYLTNENEYTGDVAQKILGLTDVEAEFLFDSRNSRVQVQRYAEAIAERAGEKL